MLAEKKKIFDIFFDMTWLAFTTYIRIAIDHDFLLTSVDPFTRKDWYDIKAPSMFDVRQVGKTLVNRTQGLSKLKDTTSKIFLLKKALILTITPSFKKTPTTTLRVALSKSPSVISPRMKTVLSARSS